MRAVQRTISVALASALVAIAGCTRTENNDTTAVETATPVAITDWPMTRGGPSLSGQVKATVPADPAIAWTFSTGDSIIAEAAIVGERIYVGTEDGTLHCLDVASGAEIWKFETGYSISAAPAVGDGMVYLSSNDGILYAVDSQTAEEIWRFETTDKISAGAILVDDPSGNGRWVLLNGYDGTTRALDSATGDLVWSYATEDFINGSPAVVDGRFVVFGGCDSQLHVVNLVDGSFVRKIPTEAQIPASIATFGGMAYCGNYANQAVGFDVDRGLVAWVYEDKRLPFFSSPAVDDTHIFIGSRDKHLHAIDRESGEPAWKFQTGGRVEGSPIAFEDAVVFGSTDGRLYGLNRENGEPVWTIDLGESLYASVAFGRGLLIIGGEGGTVFAIR